MHALLGSNLYFTRIFIEAGRLVVASPSTSLARKAASLNSIALPRLHDDAIYFFVTMSGLVLATMLMSSFCSAAGTLNWSNVALKSATIASHSFSVMLRWL